MAPLTCCNTSNPAKSSRAYKQNKISLNLGSLLWTDRVSGVIVVLVTT